MLSGWLSKPRCDVFHRVVVSCKYTIILLAVYNASLIHSCVENVTDGTKGSVDCTQM